jgi:hypothetical protein
MSAPAVITAPQTAEEILKGFKMASSAVASAASYGTTYVASYGTSENGSYILNVLFYIVLYLFVLFLILLLIHFTIYPVFKFTPGAKGFIGVPASNDSIVYWKDKKQPGSSSQVPMAADALDPYMFQSNFSFSVDLFVRRMTDTNSTTRVILYKTAAKKDSQGNNIIIPAPLSTEMEDIQTLFMNKHVSMYMYLTKTNDLGLTFYSGTTPTAYSIREIKNIPLYTPFRVTVVVNEHTFTVYINAQQAFQRSIQKENTTGTFSLNSSNNLSTSEPQRFYSSPSWADHSLKTVFLQNFILWPRAISYREVQTAQPALALESDFDAPKETNSSKCA